MIELYIDGASSTKKQRSGIGIYLKGEGHQIRISNPIPYVDNHLAEFTALLHGLEEARRLSSGMISVRTDSQVVVDTIEARKTKNEQFAPLVQEILLLTAEFDFFFIKWIDRAQNRTADQLAKKALNI